MSQKVTTVIPTYNGLRLLEKYLDSVIQASRSGDEILIVDDNSADETVETLRTRYSLQQADKPEGIVTPKHYYPNLANVELSILYGSIQSKGKKIRLVLLALKKNLRFAGAANTGVFLASHPLIFLINNDVQVEPGAIEALTHHFDDANVFAVGALEYEGTSTGDKAGKNVLWFEKGVFLHSKAGNFDAGETSWASGGSAMFNKEKWLILQGFDRRYYPAYWEDLDLSFRARKKGWKVLFDPAAVVIHKHETTNNSIFGRKQIETMSTKNMWAFTWKNSTLLQKLQIIIWLPYWKIKHSL